MIEAIVFDLGGVVLGSPLRVIADYENELGLEPGVINRVVVGTGRQGAWSRHERGVLPFADFCRLFNDECRAAGALIDAYDLMARIHEVINPQPEMLAAVARLRQDGYRVAALTNNWEPIADHRLRAAFDVIVESSVAGVRKPEPEIYQRVLEALGVDAGSVVFLDDIGANLKPARALGMATIKVTSPSQALDDLGTLLGIEF